MGKKILLSIATAIIIAFPCRADAQQRERIPHVGILSPSAPSTAADANLEAFRQGLRDLGYVEGRNIILEYRWAENREDRYPPLIADLIRLKVDIIYTSSTPAVIVAKQATKTTPIVFPVSSDPVSVGIVASLARPGGKRYRPFQPGLRFMAKAHGTAQGDFPQSLASSYDLELEQSRYEASGKRDYGLGRTVGRDGSRPRRARSRWAGEHVRNSEQGSPRRAAYNGGPVHSPSSETDIGIRGKESTAGDVRR